MNILSVKKKTAFLKKNDTFLKEDIIPHESDILMRIKTHLTVMNYQLFFLYINFFLGNSNRQFADRFMNVVN